MKIRAERSPYSSQSPTASPAESNDNEQGLHQLRPEVVHEKKEALPRPKIQELSRDSDFIFFQSQWNRYVKGTQLTDEQQILLLWAACSENIQRMLHSGRNEKVKDPKELLEHICLLAVKRKKQLGEHS